MYPKKPILILIMLLTVGPSAFAQGFFRNKAFQSDYIELGIHTGPSIYLGELNNNLIGFDQVNPFEYSSWSAGASLKQYFASTSAGDRTWGIRLDYHFTQLNGTGAEPNAPVSADTDHFLRFSNRIHEFAILGEFQFWEFRPTRERFLITPYVFAGVGGMYHHPKAPDNSGSMHSLIDQLVELNDPQYGHNDEGVEQLTGFDKESKWVAHIPFGAGIKYNFSGPLSIAIELNYRYAFTDFLDGIGSEEYLDYNKIKNKLPEDPGFSANEWETLVAPSTKAGTHNYSDLIGRTRGQKGNDFFMTTVFKATWTFYKYRDPSWK